MGGDRTEWGYPSWPWRFNPLPPCGGRLSCVKCPTEVIAISIHSPPYGGRWRAIFIKSNLMNFNPLPLRGGRRSCMIDWQYILSFQSTLPHGGRKLAHFLVMTRFKYFNPLPRVEGDNTDNILRTLFSYFNPPLFNRGGVLLMPWIFFYPLLSVIYT